jgi:hypothetical protein
MLELVNRMRANPAAELPRLLNSGDPNVNFALGPYGFNVNKTLLAQQWATLTPAPPLAWNDLLANAALKHSQKFLPYDQATLLGPLKALWHQLPGEPPMGTRLTNEGYNWSSAG